MDVVSAFLNGNLQEEIYMRQPPGLAPEPGHRKDAVCKLGKAIYGLKQSGREWFIALTEFLTTYGFLACPQDESLFCLRGGEMVIAVYVDDLLIVAEDQKSLDHFKQAVARRFKIKDLGIATQFLGMEICYLEDGSITLGQGRYCREILARFGFADCKPVATPMDPGVQLRRPQQMSDADQFEVADKPYQAVLGSVMYLMTATRPDLAYAVGMLSRFSVDHDKTHWMAMKHLLRYIQGTKDCVLRFKKSARCVNAYSDSNFKGCFDTGKSTSGYVVQIGTNTVSWSSRKQDTVALSTTEAEYIGLANGVKEVEWVKAILHHIGTGVSSDKVDFTYNLHGDNQGALALARNAKYHPRTKHIPARYHYLRDVVTKGLVTLHYLATSDMVADIMTKALGRNKVQLFCSALGLVGST